MDMDINIKINYRNDFLKAKRLEKNLSQSQLADMAQISTRMIQYYEQGAREIEKANVATLAKICCVLECKMSEIVVDEETKKILQEYERL